MLPGRKVKVMQVSLSNIEGTWSGCHCSGRKRGNKMRREGLRRRGKWLQFKGDQESLRILLPRGLWNSGGSHRIAFGLSTSFQNSMFFLGALRHWDLNLEPGTKVVKGAASEAQWMLGKDGKAQLL